MLLIFPMFPHYPPMPEEDVVVSRKLIRLLIDFGKKDTSPIDEWKPLHLDNPSYLHIDKTFEVKSGLPLQDRINFWRTLPSIYWNYRPVSKNSHVRDEL